MSRLCDTEILRHATTFFKLKGKATAYLTTHVVERYRFGLYTSSLDERIHLPLVPRRGS